MFGRKTAIEHQENIVELARALRSDEYSTLRAEILSSYGYAQSIVKWTLATFAALATAGLVAINDSTGVTSNPILINIVLLLFAFGLPAVIWLNAWTWLGELYRAERAGSYLRAIEHEIAQVKGVRTGLGTDPVRWERFIWSNRRSRTLWGKQVLTYLGTAGTFFGCAFGSAVILGVVLVQLLSDGQISLVGPWLWAGGALAANGVAVCICFVIYRRLMRIGDAAAPLSANY